MSQVKESKYKGNWGQSEVERVLKYLQTRSLSRVGEDVINEAHTHGHMLEAMKKEFRNCRIWWRTIFDYVSGELISLTHYLLECLERHMKNSIKSYC